MSEPFHVSAKSGEVLDRSHLVAEMKEASKGVEIFPVLIGEFVGHFHMIDGGYHRSEGYHVVNFIHQVQGPDSPPHKKYSPHIEAHIGDTYFYLEVEDVWSFGDYPNENYILSAKVTGYDSGPYAFSEELQATVDKRETEYSYQG